MAINSFADWLNDVMAERDIRPADLARLANINKGILSRILSNERRPAPETADVQSAYRRAAPVDRWLDYKSTRM